MPHIPILTYHSLNTRGSSYADNDHVALEQDLALIKSAGFRVERLPTLVTYFLEGRLEELSGERICALTFDDGVLHDFADFYHPHIGLLKSFARLLAEASEASRPEWQCVPATAFVIVSPEARAILDVECIAGRDQWHDHWWQEAVDRCHLDIGNHSWNHTHPALAEVADVPGMAGNFFCIDTDERARDQIIRAEDYLEGKLGEQRSRLFAYPYGHVNDYLRETFFPAHAARFRAAFSTAGDYFSAASDRWAIPRFVCGEHWKTPEALELILAGAVEGTKPTDNISQRFGKNGPSPGEDVAPSSPSGAAQVQSLSAAMPVADQAPGSSPASRNSDTDTRLADAKTPPFFLVGCVRSGTTLLRDLLKQQPDLHCPEETHLFRWPHPFATGDFNHIQRHNETLIAHRKIDGVDEERYLELLGNAVSRRDLQDGYAALFFEAKGIKTGRWFDKTPQNVYGMLLLSAVYPAAKFVHIVRHPLNVVASLKAGKVMGPHSLQAAINTWLEAVSIVREFETAWPDRLHTLTYEVLTTSPEDSVKSILAFLGEPFDAASADFTRVHSEQNRFERALSPEEVETVRAQLGSHMARYGYA
ncbi:MAG: sulfotransferase [Luminiphilus sp.]|nr:sulfotransferase [Luminiphilus sp.]